MQIVVQEHVFMGIPGNLSIVERLPVKITGEHLWGGAKRARKKMWI